MNVRLWFAGALVVVLALGALQRNAVAQHDPQRNAVRHIAAERWGALEKELAKADADDPETHFVRLLAALRQGANEDAAKRMRAALAAGLPFERIAAIPRDLIADFHATDAYREAAAASPPSALLHGPMLGAVTDRSAQVWVRTLRPAKVACRVFNDDGIEVAKSQVAETTESEERTATLRVDGLKPQQEYAYRIVVDGEEFTDEAWRLRTYAKELSPSRFVVGMGGGAGFVPKWEYAWDAIRSHRPDAFLMLGDNVYIDDPTHRLTSAYCYSRRQARPEWRRFTAGACMYAIYDDHDFGTNDCVPGPSIEEPTWKRKVWREFQTNWVNPAYGGGKEQPGCWFDFYIGDVHFILLDGRYYRTRGENPTMLGPVQRRWLEKTLAESKGVFKVLASPVPWSEGVKPGSKDPWDGFPEEREEIFDFIQSRRIEGVVLAAADRHRTDLRVTQRPGAYPLYEIESSKLTNRHTHGVVKTPGLIWGYNKRCSFALLKFDTAKDDPEIVLEARTIDGELVHSHTLRRSELSFPD